MARIERYRDRLCKRWRHAGLANLKKPRAFARLLRWSFEIWFTVFSFTTAIYLITILGKHSQQLDLAESKCLKQKSVESHLYKIHLSVGGCCLFSGHRERDTNIQ